MCHLRMVSIVLAFWSLVATASNATASNIAEKKFPFPSPIQWKKGKAEISLIGLAWGPANSPDMISRGREKQPREKPGFFSDRSYAIAVGFRAEAPGFVSPSMHMCSGLLRIKNVNGDRENPSALTPSGFTAAGSPGECYNVHFAGSNTTEYWDFFPVSPDQREFLFQVFLRTGPPMSNLTLSFKVFLKDNDIVIVTPPSGIESQCRVFTRNFRGTVGPDSKVTLQLTRKGTTLSGTHQYVRIGKTLWLKGQVDSFGKFILEEQYPQNRVTGIFKGRFSRGCRIMTGYFSKPDGSRLQPFEFHEVRTPSARSVPRGWKTYTDHLHCFSISYPPDYKRVVNPSDRVGLIRLQYRRLNAYLFIYASDERFDLQEFAKRSGFITPPSPVEVGDETFYVYGPGGGGVCYADRYFFNLRGNTLSVDFAGPCVNSKTPTEEIKTLEPLVLGSLRVF